MTIHITRRYNHKRREKMDVSLLMFASIPSLIQKHYRNGTINWPMGTYVSLVHIASLVGVTKLTLMSHKTLIWVFFFCLLGMFQCASHTNCHRSFQVLIWDTISPTSGFGITVEVHRLWISPVIRSCASPQIFVVAVQLHSESRNDIPLGPRRLRSS